jgi:hypothetical protein
MAAEIAYYDDLLYASVDSSPSSNNKIIAHDRPGRKNIQLDTWLPLR